MTRAVDMQLEQAAWRVVSVGHAVELPRSGDAFEFVFTVVAQFDVGAGDQVGHGARDERRGTAPCLSARRANARALPEPHFFEGDRARATTGFVVG
jgi:hypothetical protein